VPRTIKFPILESPGLFVVSCGGDRIHRLRSATEGNPAAEGLPISTNIPERSIRPQSHTKTSFLAITNTTRRRKASLFTGRGRTLYVFVIAHTEVAKERLAALKQYDRRHARRRTVDATRTTKDRRALRSSFVYTGRKPFTDVRTIGEAASQKRLSFAVDFKKLAARPRVAIQITESIGGMGGS